MTPPPLLLLALCWYTFCFLCQGNDVVMTYVKIPERNMDSKKTLIRRNFSERTRLVKKSVLCEPKVLYCFHESLLLDIIHSHWIQLRPSCRPFFRLILVSSFPSSLLQSVFQITIVCINFSYHRFMPHVPYIFSLI